VSAPPSGDQTNRFFVSLGRLSAALLDAVSTRLELAATELEEELLRVALLLLGGLAALLCLVCSLATLAVLAIAAMWDTYRLTSIGVLAGIFMLLAVVAGILTVRGIRRHPRLFSATVQELKRDRERFVAPDR